MDHLRLGIWRADSGAPAVRLEQALRGSTALEIHSGPRPASLLASLARGEIRGLLVIDDGFSRALAGQGNGTPQALLLTDGSEPNTANFVTNYAWGIWQGVARWRGVAMPVSIESRAWFNPALVSRNFLVPGSIAVVMTIMGPCSPRWWWRGVGARHHGGAARHPVTKGSCCSQAAALLWSCIIAMLLCLLFSVAVMGVPWRLPAALFWSPASFSAAPSDSQLFLSTVMRSQFQRRAGSADRRLSARRDAVGLRVRIASMPPLLRAITHLISGPLLRELLQTLYQAGSVFSILLVNGFCLLLLAGFWLALTARKTRRTLGNPC